MPATAQPSGLQATVRAGRRPQTEVAWTPHPGSQALFTACPVYEALYHGTRGPGKTDALLMDYLRDVGRGYGPAWRGILFRVEAKQMEDVRARCQKWVPRIFPHASYVGGAADKWRFPEGEELLLRHMKRPEDYWKYHGHEYPWIGWEELTNWPTGECYHVMKSTSRCSTPGVPRRYRATCNPYGPGHNWIKAYFIDQAPPGEPFVPQRTVQEVAGVELEEPAEPLQAVHLLGHYSENRTLMEAQPDYAQNIAASARNPEQARAWLAGDWDIVAGGMFDDVWSRRVHVHPGWALTATPASWRLDRSFDWGSSAPFSVGWWAESDGTVAPDGRVYPRGTLFRIAEWYGWHQGRPNVGLRMDDTAIARGIREREQRWGLAGRVKPGPADASIFNADPGRESIADVMSKHGVRWTEADKKPGSRVAGWQAVRRMLGEAMTLEEAAAESGYAYDTIQRQVASGELGNAGEKGSPRVLRRDLPRRAPRTRPRHLRLEGEGMVEDMVTRALTARRAGTL